MRIRGRRLYPSTLAERRLLMSLGGVPLYAPRRISPYLIARRIARVATGASPDLQFVRDILGSHGKRRVDAPALGVGNHCRPELANAPDSVAA